MLYMYDKIADLNQYLIELESYLFIKYFEYFKEYVDVIWEFIIELNYGTIQGQLTKLETHIKIIFLPKINWYLTTLFPTPPRHAGWCTLAMREGASGGRDYRVLDTVGSNQILILSIKTNQCTTIAP